KTPSIKHDNVIGHYLDLYAGYVAEGEYRKNGSSGGFGTWIAVQLLEKGFIDGIVHVKACDDSDGILFKYCVSNTVEEILGRSKSRYYPVELSGSLNEILLEDKKYAITGTPSVIMEVRLLALKNKDIDKRIKYAIGLVTGHHKSAKYSDALAWEQGIKPGDLIKIDYRKKVDGKLSSEYNTEFTGYIDGEIKTFTSQSGKSFVGDWGHGFFKSKVSDFTDDTFNETADVVLGDAWLPQYREDSRGTNIIIVRNPEIAEIIKDGLSKNALHLDNLDAQTICRSQSGLIHHTRDELPYRLHKKDKANLWRPKKRFEASSELPLIRKYVQNIREKISTKSHTKFKEAVERDDWSYFERSMKLYVIQYRIAYTLIRIRSKTPADIIKFIRKKLLS
ncbi:coenzyme F420 hydrogenase, partial [Candidatus Saccharibacteria bacterium]|nr:coenzyme F420 hydrogenase [Candidatus Saccharibacteria bacterium]